MSSSNLARASLQQVRTGWDVTFGVLTVLAGFVVLGHVAVASLVSVLFLGWLLVIGGLLLIMRALIAWREAANWWGLVSGGAIGLLGILMVRNPAESLLVLTLLAGSLLFVGGIARIAAALQEGAPRTLLLVSGVATLALAVLILTRFPVSALWYIGTLLGVTLIVDGVTTALTGRLRPVASPVTPEAV